MDRAPSSSQPQQRPPARRPNNDSFRPALRFPTDPHRPSVLPSKIHHIVSPPTASSASAASYLLQSRRKPWEVDVTRLDELVRKSSTRKVVCVVGDPSPSSLEPILSSSYLRGSLVIIIASAESTLSSISPQNCVPAVRILRLRPGPASSPQQQANPDNQLTASRLNGLLDWAERVANGWRLDPPAQPNFAILHEGEGPQDGVGKWKKKGASRVASPIQEEADGSLLPWTRRFALNSRSNTSSLASASSGSLNYVDIPGRPSASSSNDGRVIRGTASSSNLAPRRTALGQQQTASAPGQISSHRAMSIPLIKTQRRFSFLSFATGRNSAPPSPISAPTPKKSSKTPSFNAIINFLPPAASSAAGVIASTQAVAAHNKLLLRQTILVTTATQRFLVPVDAGNRGSDGGRFGSMQRGRPVLTPSSTEESSSSAGSKKRWSRPFSAIFGGTGVSAKTAGKKSALPTPPTSRPSSAEENRPPFNSQSSSFLLASGARSLPKLVHVLPFSSALSEAVAGNARLVRNLEAFLLSWSFGGARGMVEEGAEEPPAGKKTIRPYLLDMSSLADVLTCSLPSGDREWSLADLILSGAIDDEYAYSGSSSPPPEVVVTRPSTDVRPSTAPNSRHSSGRWGADGLTLADLAAGAMDEAWALRRAWLGGVSDLSIYPNALESRSRTLSLEQAIRQTPVIVFTGVPSSKGGHRRSESSPGLDQDAYWAAERAFHVPAKTEPIFGREKKQTFLAAAEKEVKGKQASKSEHGHATRPQKQMSQPDLARARSMSSKELPDPPDRSSTGSQFPPTSWYTPVPAPQAPKVKTPTKEVDAELGGAKRPALQARESSLGTLTTLGTMTSYSTNASTPMTDLPSIPIPPLPVPGPPSPARASINSIIDDYYSSDPPTSILKKRSSSSNGDHDRSFSSGYVVIKTTDEPEAQTPKQPSRPSRNPPPASILAKTSRPGSGSSSPLRNAVSSDPIKGRRPGTSDSEQKKQLPITPPDSASSSSISNDVHEEKEKRSSWWSTR